MLECQLYPKGLGIYAAKTNVGQLKSGVGSWDKNMHMK